MLECVIEFHLVGDVSSEDLEAVRAVLGQIVRGTVVSALDGLLVKGTMYGADAREVNRRLLSAMRRVERRTRLRAQWTAGGVSYRFFDYASRGTSAPS